jgi:7-keto-8-aminopelargonate synthetase-like enzyme
MNQNYLNSQLSKVYNIIKKAADLDVIHLTAQEESYSGREMTMNDKKYLNFSSCSYLGLALDQRLIDGAIDGARRFGTSFSMSRSFVTLGYLEELEEKLEQLFGYSCLVTTSTSLLHTAFLPTVINAQDVFISDHQLHNSIRVASEIVKSNGCKSDIIRHNDLDSLEEKIIAYSKTHRHVWYFADGVYSMYGDKAPIKKLYALLEKYDSFHLYVDDAHGMSWAGENGKGFVLGQVKLHPRMFLSTSLAKGFGSIGGVLICYNKELKQMIKYCGSSFIFSGPIPPTVIGASIASAEIHLSDEINDLQLSLQHKIKFFREVALELELPLLGNSDTPICFIPSGNPDTCCLLSQKMMALGFYQSSAIYPSVPYHNGGMRFTLSNWHTMEDMERVLHVFAEQRRKVLFQAKISEDDIRKRFKGVDFAYVNEGV